jgi:hypothetical protein
MINTVVRQIGFYSFEATWPRAKNGELTAEQLGEIC